MKGESGKDVENICQKVITKLGHVIQADPEGKLQPEGG